MSVTTEPFCGIVLFCIEVLRMAYMLVRLIEEKFKSSCSYDERDSNKSSCGDDEGNSSNCSCGDDERNSRSQDRSKSLRRLFCVAFVTVIASKFK